jgi:ribosome biogenesis GTPase
MPDELICTGLVIQAQSGFFTVATERGTFVCGVRGKLKRGRAKGDLVALGDRVQIQLQPDGSGVIESVQDRTRAIVRLDPRPRGVYRQVLLANADQPCPFLQRHPEPGFVCWTDFVAEKQRGLIVAIKADLVPRALSHRMARRIHRPAYP